MLPQRNQTVSFDNSAAWRLTKHEGLIMFKEALFKSLRLGAIQLPNRIVMAPLTRMRAGAANVPTALNAEYYAQRASAGLIISEGTAISPQAQGYPNAPGIYSVAQIAGWRAVTDRVHGCGGRALLTPADSSGT